MAHRCVYSKTILGLDLAPLCAQFVRWKKIPQRKPIWALKRERKLYFVPVKPKVNEAEAKEISDRTKFFKTDMKSFRYDIQNFFNAFSGLPYISC